MAMAAQSLAAQLIHLSAALLLLTSFAMMAQRRILSLVRLFAWQGLILSIATAVIAYSSAQAHLYVSAALSLGLKAILLPAILHRLIERLEVRWDTESLFSIPVTQLIGILLVVFAFALSHPLAALSESVARSTLGIALAVVLLSFLTMITRRKAISQVVGFLAMENGLFFAAVSATHGMPMVVELGVALDVLVGALILGLFFFQIREQFDSLDLSHLEKLKEE